MKTPQTDVSRLKVGKFYLWASKMNCSAIEQNKIIQNLSTTTDQKVSSAGTPLYFFSCFVYSSNLLVNSIIIKKLKDYKETVLADEHF